MEQQCALTQNESVEFLFSALLSLLNKKKHRTRPQTTKLTKFLTTVDMAVSNCVDFVLRVSISLL